MELEHKADWTVRMMNFDIKSATERRMIQLNELDEIRFHAYENSKLYKERTKAYHDKKIISRNFEPNDQVLLYNSRLHLFLENCVLVGQVHSPLWRSDHMVLLF